MADAFVDILESNRAYATGFDLAGLQAPAAKGLGVLTCIDSRIEPLPMLGLEPGDAKIVRNAGARVTDDVIRTFVLATNLLEVRRIMVIAHTDCAMAGKTDEELRAKIEQLRPGHDVPSAQAFHAAPDQELALTRDVEVLRGNPLLAEGVVIGGFVYDVTTGLLRQVVD